MKLSATELMVILAIVLILFGPTQIPKLTKMFKKSSDSFKVGMEEAEQKSISHKVQEEAPAEKAVEEDYREVQ